MMKKILLHLIFLIVALMAHNFSFAQSKMVLGKVVAKTRDLEGIYVKNLSTNNAVTTEKGGYFKIEASPNDTLLVSAHHLIGREKVLTYADMNKSLVFVPMEFVENVMEELVINKKITAQSLGFPSVRKLTPAQRRLYTATSSGGGIIPIDALVNAISGRTKMLEKAVELEREQLLVQSILAKFDSDFYINKLKIPEQYYLAFGYFLAQDAIIVTSYQTVDHKQLALMYTEIAVDFLDIVHVLK